MNQNPEQLARDEIDRQLIACGWVVQDKKTFNLNANIGVAIREFQTSVGPADYVLFVSGIPVGLIEAKREEEGVRLTVVEGQSEEYAKAKIKHVDNTLIRFVYESTGEVTRFTDYRDPKPRSRPVFSFHRPQTFERLLRDAKTLRSGVHDIPALQPDGLRDCQVTAITNWKSHSEKTAQRP